MIQLYHVTMQYPSGIEALREVNLRLHEGEFVFVAGRSGAGKSTLMKLMGAELVPTSGQILVAGRNLGVLRRSQVPYFRRGLGIVWQDFRLLPDRTVTENVALPLEVLGLSRRKIALRVAQVLELVGMEQYAEARALWLSGGEQQRVAIARALVNEPSIILADEPTGNLDPDLAYEVVQMLRDVQSRGTTVVVATHNTALLELFNERVVLLNKGFVIEDEGGEPVAAPPSDPEALQ
ncbi:MAG: cell division ATP-binding protein FtsE [Deltaproteobacteria bacterium HGW-Deltaproteobacteria-14]|nr:MAG: cell division ATP-binding protein FtsE [Deltaproteobacteria bacterium HGW-Deltaproteobacteria-14]